MKFLILFLALTNIVFANTDKTNLFTLGTVGATTTDKIIRFRDGGAIKHNATLGKLQQSADGTTYVDMVTPNDIGTPTLNSAGLIVNCSIATSVAGSALTISLKDAAGNDPSAESPCKITFQNSTLTTGSLTTISTEAAASLVVPNGATLGSSNAGTYNYIVAAVNNSGTISVGISGINEENLKVQTSTAMSTGADSIGVLYTGAALTGMAVQYIGVIKTAQATAGVWITAPSSVWSGWNASISKIVSSVSALYTGAPPTGTQTAGAYALVTFGTKVNDTLNSYASGTYTIREDGNYSIATTITNTVLLTSGQFMVASIYIDGVAAYKDRVGSYGLGSALIVPVSVSAAAVPLNKGQTVSAYLYTSAVGTFSTDATTNWLSIKKD